MNTNIPTKSLSLGSIFRKVGALMMGTMLIASTNLTLAAEANNLGGGGAYRDFKDANPGVANNELRQMFKDQINIGGGNGGGINSLPQPVINDIQSGPANHAFQNLNADSISKAEMRAAKQALRLDIKDATRNINNTYQNTGERLVNAGVGISLDLNSTIENITLGNNLFKTTSSVTINVGGETKTLAAGDKVTAAEYVAAKQVLVNGGQQVTVDGSGKAIGGNVDLSAMSDKSLKVGDLSIGENVTAYGDFGKGGDVKITGDFTNSGEVVAFSSKNNVPNAAIRADNITNNAGAIITTQLTAGAKELGGVDRKLGLTLDAANNLSNFGTINSAGDLTLSAGNTLTNSGTITAQKDVNVLSPNVVNSGRVESISSNINIDAPNSSALNVTNTNGTVAALKGDINIRNSEFTAAVDTKVTGGDLLSKELNVNAGAGVADVKVNQISGLLNQKGLGSHVQVEDGDLNLGQICLTGDPTYYNSTGSINISGDIVVGETLTIIANQNITSANNINIRANNATQGFDINLIAGANIQTAGGVANNIAGTPPGGASAVNVSIGTGGVYNSTLGGDITLGTGVTITSNALAPVDTSNGGNVNIIAMVGSVNTTRGNVSLGGTTINTAGGATANNGNVTIFSGGTGTKTIGNINTVGGSGNNGDVSVYASQATATNTANPIVYGVNGDLVGPNAFTGSGTNAGLIEFAGTTTASGAVRAEGLTGITFTGATSGASIFGFADGAITVNSSLTSSAGDISLAAVNNVITGAGDINAGLDDIILGANSITSTGLLSAHNLTVFAQAGNIGTSDTSRLRTNVDNIDLTATSGFPGSGNIWVSEVDGLAFINNASANKQFHVNSLVGGPFSFANFDIYTEITGNDITLQTASGGEIAQHANITSSGQVTLIADMGITRSAGTIIGTAVTLTATNRNIGSISNTIRTEANTLTLTANNADSFGGGIFINELNAAQLNATSTNQNLIITSGGTLTVAGITNAEGQLQLTTTAGNIILNNTVGNIATIDTRLQANGSILGISQVAGATLEMTATNGSVGTNANRVRTSANLINGITATNGSIYVIENDAVNLGPLTANLVTGVINISNANAGTIDVIGDLRANDIRITSAAASDITLNANLLGFGTATQIFLNAGGSITGTGGISADTVNLTSIAGNIGSSAANRVFTNAGTLLVTANATAVGAGNAWIDENSSVNFTGTANKQLYLDATAGLITVSGATSAADVRLDGGAITVDANVTGTSNLTLTAVDSINGSAKAIGPVVNLTANNSNIGSSPASRFNTAAGILNVNGTAATNVWINEEDGVNLGANSTGGQFYLNTLASGAVNINGALIGSDIQIATAAGGSVLAVSSNVGNGSTTNVSLSADGALTGLGIVTGATVSLTSTSSSIGTSATSRLRTTAGSLNLTANNGSAFINETDAVNLTTASVNAGGTLAVATLGTGSMNVNTNVSGGTINLATVNAGSNIVVGNGFTLGTNASTVNVSAGGNISTGTFGGGGVIAGNAVTLSSVNGNIGSNVGNNALALNATTLNATANAGDITVTSSSTSPLTLSSVSGNVVAISSTAGGADLNLGGAVNGATSVALTTAANGDIYRTSAAGVITAPTVTLTSGGNVGTLANRILTDANTLTVIANTAGANAFISEVDAVTLGATSSANATFDLVAGGNLALDNLSGTTVKLATTNGGNIIRNAGSVSATSLTLTSDSGNIGAAAVGTNGIFTNAGTISASTTGDIYINDTNAGTVNVGVLSGSIVALNTALNMALQQNVTGTSSVSLTAGGAGNITQLAGRTITTPNLALASATGNIGAGNAITTNAANLSAITGAPGTVNIVDTSAGPVSVNALSGATMTVTTTGAGSSLIANGPITGGSVNLLAGLGTNGGIIVNSNINVTGTANLTADGSGNITNPNGVIGAGTLNLTSSSGNIGTFAKYIQTTAPILTANTSGNVYVNDTGIGGITLGASAGNNFNVTFNSDLTVNGGIFGNVINLTGNTGTNAGVILLSGMTGTTSVAINANGSGTITQIGGASTLINTPTVVLTSGSGDIGSPSNPIFINATNTTTNTTGSVFLSNTNSGPINIGPSTGYDYYLNFNGTINVVGVLQYTNNVSLLTGNSGSINVNAGIIAGNQILLQAGGIGNVTQASGVLLDSPILIVRSSGGNLGTSTNAITTNASTLTAFTTGLGDAFIRDINAGNVLLAGTNGAGVNFNLLVNNAAGTSVSTALAGIVVGPNANITSVNGSVGAGVLAPLNVNVGNLGVHAAQNVYVTSNTNLNLTASDAGNNFVVASNQNLSSSGAITGNTVVLGAVANGGILTLAAPVTATTSIGLVADGDIVDGSFTVLNAPTLALVSLNGNIGVNGNALDINSTKTPTLVNLALDADNGLVNVTSTLTSTINLADVSFPALGIPTATNQSGNSYNFNAVGNINVNSTGVDSGNSIFIGTTNGDIITNAQVDAAVGIFMAGKNVTTNALVNASSSIILAATAGALTINGTVSSTSGTVNASGTGTVTTTGAVSGSTVSLTSSTADLQIHSTITGTTAVNLSSNANLENSNISSAVFNTPQLNLTSVNGGVGATGALNLTAGSNVSADLNLSVNAQGNGDIFYTGTTLNLAGATSVVANTLTVESTGNLNSSSAVTASNLNLTAGGAMQLLSSVTGSISATLLADGNITNDGGVNPDGLITSQLLTATSTNGNIATDGDRLHTKVDAVSLTALNGGVHLSNAGNLTINDANAQGMVCIDTLEDLVTGGDITVNGAINGNEISLLAIAGGTPGDNAGNININAAITGAGVNNIIDLGADGDIAINSGGTLDAETVFLFAGKGITTAATITTNNLVANAQNNISIGANVTGNGMQPTLMFTAGGSFTNLAGAAIEANSIYIDANSVSLNDTVTGVGPSNLVTVISDLTINAVDVAQISAQTLNLTSSAGDIGGALDRIITNVDFLSLNAFGSAFVTETDNVTLNASSAGTILSVRTDGDGLGGAITVAGLLTADQVSLNAETGTANSGDLTVLAAITATTDANLSADGIFTSNVAGVITGADILIGADSATIDGNLVATGSTGTVYVLTGVNLTQSSTSTISGNVIDLTSTTGAISVSGALTGTGTSSSSSINVSADGSVTLVAGSTLAAHTITLNSTTAGVDVGGTVNSSTYGAGNSVSLSSFDSITAPNTALLTGETINLTSANGDIGASGAGVALNAQNISVHAANGSAYVSQLNDVNVLASNAKNVLDIEIDSATVNGGNITVSGLLTATDILLTGRTGTTSFGDVVINAQVIAFDGVSAGTIVINADGDINNSALAQLEAATSIALTAGDDVGLGLALNTFAPALTVNAFGNVNIAHLGSVDLGASSAGGELFLTTTDGNITVSGVTTANDLALTANSGLLTAGNIAIDAAITGTSSVVLDADGSITGTAVITGPSTTLTSGTGGITAALTNGALALSFAVNAGANDASITYSGTNTATMNTSNANDMTLVATDNLGVIATGGNSTFAGTLDITTNVLTNLFTLEANTINVTNNAGFAGGLTINGGLVAGASLGTLANPATVINLTSVAGPINFTGILDFYGVTNINAPSGQNINVANDSLITGHDAVYVTGNAIVLSGNGQLIGAPLITDVGSIVNQTGSVTLTGDVVFLGRDTAIIARDSINAGTATTINLSNANGNGGTLTMIAGYDFDANPTIPGGQQDTDAILSNFTPPSVGGGNINLAGVIITTAATGTGLNAGNGGNVVAVANGTITLGPITTSTSDLTSASTAGNVTVIGNGGVTVGNIAATAAGGGTPATVTLAVAQPVFSPGYQIAAGTSTGSITAGAATAGDLVYNDIAAGTVNVTGALTSGTDTIFGNGFVTANVINANTGAGFASLGTTTINTINSAASGASVVSLTNTSDITLGTITGTSQNLAVSTTGTSAINHTSGIIQIGVLNLDTADFNLTGGTISGGTTNLTATGAGTLTDLGTVASNTVNLTQATSIDDATLDLSGITATNLGLRVTGVGANIGNSTADRFLLPTQFANVTAVSDAGSVFLQSNVNGYTLNGGSAAGDFDFLGAGNTTVAGNITTTDGDIRIVTALNRITVNAGVSLHANGTTAGNGNILVQVSDSSKNAKKTSGITINGTLETDALASPDGLITISVGAVTAPVAGKVPKSGVVVTQTGGGLIFWGKKASKFNGVSNFIAKGTNIVINNALGANAVIFNSATIDADPPVAADAVTFNYTPKAAAAAPAALATDAQGAMQTMFGFDTDNAMVTSDLSVLNLDAALATGNVANLTQANPATSGQARANTTFAQVADDDDSYVVGYAAATGETGAAICSDVEIGVAQGKGIEKVQHGDRVVIKKGNVLFVPFKDTTVETPKGNVHIAAKSVALVSISEAGLAVYDLEDQHKGSVSVESNGHNVILSPGRHVLFTAHHKAEFAQVNAIETVAHRNVSSTIKNGTKAHVTEFSIPTALDTIAPLKAMVKSNHPEAKKIADRMMKTTAIILQIGGGAGQYQHYFRPRMTAMGN